MIKKLCSLILTSSLLFSLIACSPETSSDVPVDASGNNDPAICWDAEPLWDFDAEVNGDWYNELMAADSGISDSYFLESGELALERIKDIYDNADLSAMDPESGLYKSIAVYRSLLGETDPEVGLEVVKAYTDKIDSVKSLGELYELYSNEEYGCCNFLLRFTPWHSDSGYLVSWFIPQSQRSFLDFQLSVMDDPKELNLRRALNNLGYDDDRISEMFENAYTVCDWIESYLEIFNQADTVYFYDDVNTADMNISVPMTEILGSLDGLGAANGFMAEETFYDFINDVFTTDNLPLIKDYLLVSSFWILPYTAYEIPFDDTDRGYDYSYNVMRTVIGYTPDMIAEEYIKRYGADMSTTEINSYILSIKTASVKVIDGIDWLSDETKELAKQKISRMGQYIGQNGHRNLLKDYELTGEPVFDLLALRVNAKHFERNQTFYVQDSRAPFGNELMAGSAFYIKYMNCLVITPYELCDPMFTDALTEEERLAYFGETLAHEIGHSSDMNGISYRWDGLYEPIVSEDDMEAYQEKLGLISDFFDGRETYFGNTINGSQIVNEAYADLFAIRVCLNILAEKENADYDLFFRTYGKAMRGFYFQQDADRFLNDTHLMAKDRINLILGQFDEFYETYDIDVTSPYYVPEDQRLDIF